MAERVRALRAILLAPFYVRSLLPSLPPSGCLEVFTNLSAEVLREWYLIGTADQGCHGYLPRLLPTPSVCPIGDGLNVIFKVLDLFFFSSRQSLAVQHFPGIYEDALKVFTSEELRFVIFLHFWQINELQRR